jgi:hypothetical protein
VESQRESAAGHQPHPTKTNLNRLIHSRTAITEYLLEDVIIQII